MPRGGATPDHRYGPSLPRRSKAACSERSVRGRRGDRVRLRRPRHQQPKEAIRPGAGMMPRVAPQLRVLDPVGIVMRYVLGLFLLVFLGAVAVFALQNTQTVAVRFLNWTLSAPLALMAV